MHLLPDRRVTLATNETEIAVAGPERWNVLSQRLSGSIDVAAVALGVGLFATAGLVWDLDWISALLMSFFALAMLRKAGLDLLLRRHGRSTGREA